MTSPKTNTQSAIKFYLQFWPVLVTIIGCAFYMGQQVASLSTDVKNVKEQVERLDSKVDSVLLGEKHTLETTYKLKSPAEKTFQQIQMEVSRNDKPF